VGAEDYGLYFSLLSFSLLFNILLDMGITNFNNRSIAQDNSILPEYFSAILPLRFILGLIYAIICITAGLILGYSKYQFMLLSFLILNNFLLSMILYLRSNISGLHYFMTDSFLSVLDRVFMIIFCSIILWGKITSSPFTIERFIHIQTISYILTALTALGIVMGYSGKIIPIIRLNLLKEILIKSFPFALLVLLMSLFNRIDSVMIERLLPDGKEQAGIYAQSFRILDAVSMFALLFAGLLLPIFSKMIKQQKPVGQLLELSSSLLMIPALALVIISLFYGREIISLLYIEHIDISARIFPLLIFSFIFISISYIFGSLLTANGSLKQLNILASLTVILNLCLNFLLIPKYKAEGSAISNVVTQAFFAFGQIILLQRIFKFVPDIFLLAKYFCFVLLLTSFGFLFQRFGISWYIGFLVIVILGISGTWIFRIIPVKGLYDIIKFEGP
jgi:O-antigen/teichoic acid export membrane protein